MSANIGQIVAEITANTAGLRRGAADAQRILNDTSNNASAAGKAIGVAFAVTAALGVVKLIDKLEDCTQVAIDNKKALMGLESVAKAYGVSVDDATKATKDFTQDGLIQMKSATTGMKNILSTGFNITEAMNLSQALKDIGAFNNVTGDLGQAFEDATKGMRTGSIELIENIGLTQKLSAVMKAAGVDISNGIDLTNNAAQREAFYNMVLKEGEKFKGNAAKLANDQASSQAKANAAMKEAADAIGNRLLPTYSALMNTVTSLAKATTEWVKETNLDKITKQAEEQETAFYGLSYAYLDLKSKTKLTADETKRYNDIVLELQKKYGEYLKNVDLEKDGYNKVKDAIDGATIALQKNIAVKLARAELEDLTEKQVKDQQKLKGYIENTTKAFNENLSTAKKIGKIRIATELVNGSPKFFEVTSEQAYKIYSDLEDKIKDTSGKISATEKNEAIKRKNILEQSLLDNANMEKNGSLFLNSIRNAKNNSDALKNLYSSTIKSREDFQKKYKDVLNKYDVTPTDFEGKQGETTNTGGTDKEKFKANMEKTLEQKKAELDYKMQADLVNANKEEENIIKLKYASQAKILEIEDAFAKEVAGAKTQKQVSDAYDKMIKAIGEEELQLKTSVTIEEGKANAVAIWEEIQKEITGYGPIKIEVEAQVEGVNIDYSKMNAANAKYQDLTSPEQYMTTYAQQGVIGAGEAKEEAEYVNKTLEDVTKSFSELAGVLDNEVISAISNIANAAMSMGGSIKGFSAAQTAGDTLGMLSGGIGIFSSAVSIFQSVGGLFHKSTYNFDEAVKKMLAGIGEKTPELQVAEYKKAVDIQSYLNEIGKKGSFTQEESEKLKSLGAEMIGGQMQGEYMGFLSNSTKELLANLEKIIPQLAGQLGTAAGDFGSAIGSALSSATTSEELKANLYDSIYGTVKSGLINAFLAGEVMKPLLDNLQQTVTLAVADGIMSPEEKAAIQALMGDVNLKTDEFYSALEAVGLNVVDAAGQLNEAADRMDNVNRNLRLADRISTITTQTSTAGITQLAGSSNIVYDFSNANLGGMTEQQVISAVSKANRMASIRKVGV